MGQGTGLGTEYSILDRYTYQCGFVPKKALEQDSIQVEAGEPILTLVPQLSKELDRCRSVPRVVIIRKGKQFQNLLLIHHLLQDFNPVFQITLSVNDGLVPRLG